MADTSQAGSTESPDSGQPQKLRTAVTRKTRGQRGFFSNWGRGLFGLDLRSLALFRVGLGLLLLADLAMRSRDLVAHYTDQGVLPQQMSVDRPSYLMVHQLNGTILDSLLSGSRLHDYLTQITGSTAYEATLFAVAAFFAMLLLFGCRTRLATVVSWAMFCSLQSRNPLTLDSGQDLLRLLLFWSMFLPLGARYSVDAARTVSRRKGDSRVVSVAALALMAQICAMYWFSQKFKTAADWRDDGSAVYYTLSLEMLTTPVGRWLLHFPMLLRGLTFFVVGIETLMPWLFFFPWRNAIWRCVLLILFTSIHLGFIVCMWIELFPVTCIVAWWAFLPSEFWDLLARRLERPWRRGLALYYDGSSSFARLSALLTRTFLALPRLRIRRLAVDPALSAEAVRHGSWALVDAEGKRFFGFAALVELMRRSPIAWPLAWIAAWSWPSAIGRWLSGCAARRRKVLGDLTCWLPLRRRRGTTWPRIVGRVFIEAFVAVWLFYVMAWNLMDLGTIPITLEIAGNRIFMIQSSALWLGDDPSGQNRYDFGAAIRRTDWDTYLTGTQWLPDFVRGYSFFTAGRGLRLEQHWAMFSPSPLRSDGWFVMKGNRKNGPPIDLWYGQPLSWEKPESVAAKFPNYRWFKYMEKFIDANSNKYYMPSMCQYVLRDWNLHHGPDEQVTSLEVFFVLKFTQPPLVPIRIEPQPRTSCQCGSEAAHP